MDTTEIPENAIQIAFIALSPYLPNLTPERLCSILQGEKPSRNTDAGQLLRVKEVAERLHCSIPTVWRRIKDGVLPAVRFGGSTRVPESAILALSRVKKFLMVKPIKPEVS